MYVHECKEVGMLINSIMDTALYFSVIMVELAVLFLAVSIIVALLQQYVLDRDKVQSAMAIKGFRSIIAGGLFGSITPFCSCSTVPILSGLLQSKVRFGAAVSFLLASPLLNPVILGLLGISFGWDVTLIYASVTFTLVILSGVIWEKAGMAKEVRPLMPLGIPEMGKPESFKEALKRATLISLGQLRSMLPYLLIGGAVGALVYGIIPEEFIMTLSGKNRALSIPLAAALGIPLYIRMETAIPVALAFLSKGMSIGVIVALIIGGSGASIPEVSLLARIFKPRLVAAFVITVFSIATLAGYFFEFLLA